MVRVLSTKEFDTVERLLPEDYKKRIEDIIKELKQNWDIGKSLGLPFFREKKMDKYRVYFLIYEDIDTVLLITISDKNAQQETIDRIKEQLGFYRQLIRKNLSNAL